ncbi:hypothetical protein KI387_042567, partial [Taxus chinensis]
MGFVNQIWIPRIWFEAHSDYHGSSIEEQIMEFFEAMWIRTGVNIVNGLERCELDPDDYRLPRLEFYSYDTPLTTGWQSYVKIKGGKFKIQPAKIFGCHKFNYIENSVLHRRHDITLLMMRELPPPEEEDMDHPMDYWKWLTGMAIVRYPI